MKYKFLKSILVATIVATSTITLNPLQDKGIQIVEAKSKIKLNTTKKTIYKGSTYTLKVKGTKKKVKWTTSNKKVATVNSKGKVTAKKKGTATITAKVSGKTLKCKITVKNKPSSYMVNLEFNKTYKNYDITGDKKSDAIKIKPQKYSGDRYKYGDKIFVYINGKRLILSMKYGECFRMKIKLVKLNNKVFLFVNGYAENDWDAWQILYEYKKGKLVKAYDFKRINAKYGYHPEATITKVTNNKIYVRHFLVSNSLGCLEFNNVYQYKNGKISRTSNISNVSWSGVNQKSYKKVKYGYMKKTKTIYTSPTSNKKKGTIKKGTKVKPIKVYMTDKKMYILLKTKSGKTGWVKGSKNIYEEPLMDECLFVG